MTFFYDLNKRLAAVNDKPETQQLNERDMGKHNNATTGFKALAKKTGGGEKGDKIAGAQFQKMKKAGQLDELSVNTLSSYGKKAEKSARRNAELSVKHQEKAFDKYNKGGASADRSWDDQEKAEKYAAISDKRNAGANLAAAKLAKKFSKGVAEGMFTKDPAIDPIIGKEINNIINRLYIRAKRTKDEYLLGTVQELFAILRNTGGTYSPPGSPGVRDVAEDASAGASSSGSVATVVKGGKGGTNLLGGPEYKGPNPFKKKKSK